ncbi:MAG: long-chain-acyl-CoA synthetase [Hyphomonas sp.]|uniref:long-chain-acyl-CoA synthetase n=1 Tax=Hyphomonas sp. TaxID=87 RepID=UPI0035294292
MNPLSNLKQDIKFLVGGIKVMMWTKDVTPDTDILVPDEFEAAVDKYRNRVAFRFDGELTTYAEFDARANRYANWALAEGLNPGEVVALLMENRPDFAAAWFGLSKVGVVSALVNTNLEGEALAHCLNIVGAKTIITGSGFDRAMRGAVPYLNSLRKVWSLCGYQAGDLARALASASDARPDRGAREALRGGDTCLYVYTSGTTGMPKAARMTHSRARTMMRTFIGPMDVHPRDRVYLTLPLYHATGGIAGLGATLMAGASAILRRKFSASRFWEDAAREGATLFVYIGELCRYLVNQPPGEFDRTHRIRAGIGNGLRPEVWSRFIERFDISELKEFYSSTEGNVSMMNIDGHPGACGRMPDWMSKPFRHIAFVKSDIETEQPVRDAAGHCIRAGVNEVGEVLGRIGADNRTRFDGYTDAKATDGKILHDVFEKGDMWFRTGDLMRRDARGYVYFVDRIGDTFRWKGENVATNEVGEAMAHIKGVETANVYGIAVPGADGKAGMAAITANQDLDIAGLHRLLADRLPGYAIPVFLRVQKEANTTGTLKFRKLELVQEGFDPAAVKDPLYVYNADADAYEPMTEETYEKVRAGGMRF